MELALPRKGDRAGNFTVIRRHKGRNYFRFRLRHDSGQEAVTIVANHTPDPRLVWATLRANVRELEAVPEDQRMSI